MRIKINNWMLVLENLLLKKKSYSLRIAKDINITPTYITLILDDLTKAGYVKTREKLGRIRWIELTDKGVERANDCVKVLQGMRRDGLL